MKPHLVGSACHRVQRALDDALGEGALSLPPALRSHAARCARCGPELAETEALLSRLRGAAAGIDLGPVPGVVDEVMAPALTSRSRLPAARRSADLRWLLGQIAVVTAVLAIAVGGTSYTVLKLHQVLSGTSPSQVAERLAAPFRAMVSAVFHSAK